MKRGIWSEGLKQEIVARNGSVQGIAMIPEEVQAVYKTAWELKQRTLIDMAAARGAFVCQSQSLNLFLSDPTYAKLTSMHFYAWKKGLKTGCYYLRTKAPVAAQKFTIDPRLLVAVKANGSTQATPGQTPNYAALEADDDSDDDISSDEEDETKDQPELTDEERRRIARRELMEKLAKAYEESVQQAKEEGCLMCSG